MQIAFLGEKKLEKDFEELASGNKENAQHLNAWHAIFGTKQDNCELGELKQAWKMNMLKYHPDKYTGMRECAQPATLYIMAGYELLKERGGCRK